MRTEIPLLQNVRVASPCHADWDAMLRIDSDRVRFCEGCRKRVYNLSAMGQAEAEGLLRAHEGHLCVRYYRRHDGTILTTDCPVGLRAAQQLVLTRTRTSIGLCLLLCVALASYRAAIRTERAPVAGVLSSLPVSRTTTDAEMGDALPGSDESQATAATAQDQTSTPAFHEPTMGKPVQDSRRTPEDTRVVMGALPPPGYPASGPSKAP